VLVPQFFLEERIGRDFPPPITHPEHFYGFIGVALSWQVAFLIIAYDVRRYRLMILPAALEKLRAIDLVFAVPFVCAFGAVRRAAEWGGDA
jgi:hypothetical protein